MKGQAMAEGEAGELSEEVKLQLLKIFTLIGGWRQRMQARPAQPAAGSSLLNDDQATYPYLMSQAVSGALVSATHHLDALRTLIQDAHVVHARAPFTLLRAALENSATAVWLSRLRTGTSACCAGCGCSGPITLTGRTPG
jgi:hypothetical protein